MYADIPDFAFNQPTIDTTFTIGLLNRQQESITATCPESGGPRCQLTDKANLDGCLFIAPVELDRDTTKQGYKKKTFHHKTSMKVIPFKYMSDKEAGAVLIRGKDGVFNQAE